jgi:uncharacterized protein (TIGR01244 family)
MTKPYGKILLLSCMLSLSHLSFANSDLTRALNPKVTVTGDMSLPKFQTLIEQGYKSVIVNRPDQEIGNTVSVLQLRNIAEKAHVSVIYQPVVIGRIQQSDVEEFAKYYNELPKPILMVCRSGNRSAQLFTQAKMQGLLHE